ncbi:MAG: translocation/assembly module TamB domain-containing protein [Acidobacteriota bacterium]
MSEETPPPAPEPADQADPPAPTRDGFGRVTRRWARRGLALVVAIVAGLLFTVLTIDLGRLFPQLRGLAERQASNYLERPAHIGRLSAMITPGDFAIEDLVIEGRRPGDRPFMRVKRVTLHLNWWPLLRNILHPQFHVELRLIDWDMTVESWPGGIHNIPKLTPKTPASNKPKAFTTTVDFAYATGGHFVYEDHGTPWRVDAPNLNFSLVRSEALKQYVGHVQFDAGLVQILGYRPMATDMSARFVLDGPRVQLQHIDLKTEGTVSHVNGLINFTRWPEQVYYVNSSIDFKTMREIFFPNETWRLGGQGEYTGSFTYSKEGLRVLAGDFASDKATVNDLDFRYLHGALIWTNTRFVVTHADSDLLGGHTRFEYSLSPLGTPTGATAAFAADYTNFDLFNLDRLMNLRGLKLAGQATGDLAMEWQNGHFASTKRGGGTTAIVAPAGVTLASVTLPAVPLTPVPEPKPFDSNRRMGPLTLGGEVHYTFDPGGTTFEPSWTATPYTYVSYSGRMAADGSSNFPFHVTSHDWQESDHLLASIMTAISGQTGAIEVAGRGTFDGAMTGRFSSPRIAGRFDGESIRAWDVTWGKTKADLVIENKYVDITNSAITGPDSGTIVADGRYALGFRSDDLEEIHSKVVLNNWPLADLRHAFNLDDWPMEGTLGMVDLDLRGRYKNMFGTGRMRIDNGKAWHEPFDSATGDLELEGTGLRVSRIEMHKGPGLMHGAARIGWDGTYAFNADGENVDVEQLENFKVPSAPLSGRLKFKATGAGSFDGPIYTFDGSIDDLFVGSEGIGAVAGRFTINNKVMAIERLQAGSGRLQVVGSGTIAFDDAYTSDLRLRFQETALDPYLKFVMTQDISPYARIIVGGSMTVKGPLATPKVLAVDTTIDDASLTLADYELSNDGPLRLRFENGVMNLASLKLKGSNTNLTLTGSVDSGTRTVDIKANGDASLSILQLKYRDLVASGGASVNAAVTGSFDAPRLSGSATITDGRLRPFDSPHGLEAVNGRIEVVSNTIRPIDLHGRIGSGDVAFGGTIGLDGYLPSEFNLTARGRSMRLRYPEGFDSIVDMDLTLTGPVGTPVLSGDVDVLKVRLRPLTQGTGFGFCGLDAGFLASGATAAIGSLSSQSAAAGPAIALDLRVNAPRMAFIDTKNARLDAEAHLEVHGTFDAPAITGSVDIVSGEVLCNGNRFFVRDGSRIDFPAGGSFDPVFNLSAETRPRLAGETYTVSVEISGTTSQITPTLSSEPYLPQTDIVALIFGGIPNPGNAEQRALGASQLQQEHVIQSAGASFLASPLTSFVGSVAERTGALDTVQITPILASESSSLGQLNPTARITLGKRISPKVFLTYSRTLSGPQDELILLEYEESDRVSWVLSRNQDRTFALDFRIRYAF